MLSPKSGRSMKPNPFSVQRWSVGDGGLACGELGARFSRDVMG